MVFKLGSSALITKREIMSAFRLLAVYPSEFHFLGMHVDGMKKEKQINMILIFFFKKQVQREYCFK